MALARLARPERCPLYSVSWSFSSCRGGIAQRPYPASSHHRPARGSVETRRPALSSEQGRTTPNPIQRPGGLPAVTGRSGARHSERDPSDPPSFLPGQGQMPPPSPCPRAQCVRQGKLYILGTALHSTFPSNLLPSRASNGPNPTRAYPRQMTRVRPDASCTSPSLSRPMLQPAELLGPPVFRGPNC